MSASSIGLVLNAVICAVREGDPVFYTIPTVDDRPALPAGPLVPRIDRTLEAGLRRWVSEQTNVALGYVEQLYTFGDEGREGEDRSRVVSIGYLGLTRLETAEAGWRDVYATFPWEDWRHERPRMLDEVAEALSHWAGDRPLRKERLALAFGSEQLPWNDERVLDRYELLYEAGLVREAALDGRTDDRPIMDATGRSLKGDHRRILATALARLRSKMKYRPLAFELMEESFTLGVLQETVEAIYGRQVHKQNFRRMVESAQLVEYTGETRRGASGRPARLYRFRPAVLRERPAPGLKVR